MNYSHKSIREQLLTLANDDYRTFAEKSVPRTKNILGIRMSQLRKIAKEVASKDWKNYVESTKPVYFEEIMLHGMVIGYAKIDIDETLGYAKNFIQRITNWAICDTFCSGLKIVAKHRNLVWSFLQEYAHSNKEFEVRFTAVMLLSYFTTDNYIDRVLGIVDTLQHESYYAKMSIAWLISICFIKFPEKTMAYLKNSALDDWTYNKSLGKIIESRRIPKGIKNIICTMKR